MQGEEMEHWRGRKGRAVGLEYTDVPTNDEQAKIVRTWWEHNTLPARTDTVPAVQEVNPWHVQDVRFLKQWWAKPDPRQR